MAGKFGIVVNTPTEPSQLFAGDYRGPINVTIAAGQGTAIPRGQVLQRNSGTGKYEVLVPGTGSAVAVLASSEPVDATADIVVPILRQGPVRGADLQWGTLFPSEGHTPQQLIDAGVLVVS